MILDSVTGERGWQAAGIAALVACLFSMYQIFCHLFNYTEPTYQRYILRIIFLVPTYAAASWFSLRFDDYSIIFDTCRDCYEAWVIYNFMALCLAYAGGPGEVVQKADGYLIKPSWTWGTCCLPPLAVDGKLLRSCKQGTLQFVFLKPVLAICTLILHYTGLYENGDWDPKQGYLYITIIYNVCYTVALYFLLLFYLGTHEVLKPFKPGLKFILIKSIIFATFWQGIIISVATSFDTIKTPSDGERLQNFIICWEMVLSAFMMSWAFPYMQYQIGGQAQGLKMSAVKHALSLHDVWSDVIHQFSGTYKPYLLYSDGGPAANVKHQKFRGGGKQDPSSQPSKDMLDLAQVAVQTVKEVELKKLDKERRRAELVGTDSDEGEHELPESHMPGDVETGSGSAPTVVGSMTSNLPPISTVASDSLADAVSQPASMATSETSSSSKRGMKKKKSSKKQRAGVVDGKETLLDLEQQSRS